MTLNEIGQGSFYFFALNPKGKTLSKDTKIKEDSVVAKAQFFYSARRLFRKITIPKSINH